MKSTFQTASAATLALFFLGCSGMLPIDDQTRLSPEIESCVNPRPAFRDFWLQNKNHKIIAAILDSGVDYNHPVLMQNIHFDLDERDRPVGVGWDFIGQDPWPAPYIGRLTTSFKDELEVIEELVKVDPNLQQYLEKGRNIVQEYMTFARHGTAVAGLVVQKRAEIGILIYRTLPPSMRKNLGDGYPVEILNNILGSIEHAVKNGAKMVVTTSFFVFEKGKNDNFTKAVRLKNDFEKIVRDNPNVLFVVSAGNCAGLQFTGKDADRVVLPPGILAENLLVVGSLSGDGTLSTFSNIPKGDLNVVFVPGENVDTISPRKMIRISGEHMRSFICDLDSITGEKYYQKFCDNLRFFMEDKNSKPDSGTSFSTAIAAHRCLEIWLDHPEMNPRQIIESLIKNAKKSNSSDALRAPLLNNAETP